MHLARRFIIPLVLLGAVSVACGSGDDDKPSGNETPAASSDDIPGSKDFAALPRYPGSHIVQYNVPGQSTLRCGGLRNGFTAELTSQRYAHGETEAAHVLQFFKQELLSRGWTETSAAADKIVLSREPVDCGDGSQQHHYTVSVVVTAGGYEIAYSYPAGHKPYE